MKSVFNRVYTAIRATDEQPNADQTAAGDEIGETSGLEFEPTSPADYYMSLAHPLNVTERRIHMSPRIVDRSDVGKIDDDHLHSSPNNGVHKDVTAGLMPFVEYYKHVASASDARDKTTSARGSIEEFETRLAKSERQLEDIKSLYMAQSTQLKDARRANDDANTQITSLQTRLKSHRYDSAMFEATASHFRTSNESFREDLVALANEKDAAIARASKLSEKIEFLEKANAIAIRERIRTGETSIMNLGAKEAESMFDYVQSRLDRETDAKDAGLLLRFLQDLCSSTNQLPASCWVNGVHVNHSHVINWGGEAVIYHGQHNERRVVVRSIRPPEGADWESPIGEETVKLIRREILTQRQLKHRNIIPLLGVFCEDNSYEVAPFIVLPYYQHGSAKNWLKQNMSPAIYEGILRDIVEGLSYLHSRTPPVIHGDLHSGNVLINDQGVALLGNFGFSRIRHDASRILSKIQITQNFRFLAPELFAPYADDGLEFGDPDQIHSTQESDIYALGMTFYELGTLQYPFHTIVSPYTAAEKALKGQRPQRTETLGGIRGKEADWLWNLFTAMWCQKCQAHLTLPTIADALDVRMWTN